MKRRIKTFIIFLILFIGVTEIFAQRERVITGAIWIRMKTDNKMYYVTGFLNGLEKAENILDINVRIQEKNEFAFTEPFYIQRTRERINDYIPKGDNRINLIIDLVDVFYSDANNLKISFEAATRIVLARNAGDIERSDMWLQEARRKIANKGY
ncbi:MAG: hypothetical protein JXR87_00635 [Candidatus Marinimicrobia bacterium]|nr:hypothetical protein [Candidatus Neomarinimicrobiota bacterium]